MSNLVSQSPMYQGLSHRYDNSKGFTLVELMVVIAIIGVLAAALFPAMSGYISRARDTTRVSDLSKVSKAINAYFIDNGVYPNNVNDAGIPPPGTYGDCISIYSWNCWGNPEPSVDVGMLGRPTRLIPRQYLDSMPVDSKNFDDGNACIVASQSWLYAYASNNTSKGYILTTRLENIQGIVNKPAYYTGTRIGCTGYANYGLIEGNGGLDSAFGIVGD